MGSHGHGMSMILTMKVFSDRCIWFPQGLNAHYFWPDGIPAHIPLSA